MPTVSPAKDTRPIELDKLNEEERRILCDINSLVRGIAESAPPVLPPKHDEPKVDVPWGRMADKDRTGQVLLIEGGRGAGKTSLLLTLLDEWRNSWERLEPGSPKKAEDRKWEKEEKECGFIAEDGKEIGQFVRHLPILDFDPIPPDMPLHAWLVHAWGDLVKWASDCPDGRTQPSPTGVRTRSLTERWQKVFRASALAFSKSPPSEHGVVGQVLNRKEQIEDWQKLQVEWRAMIDSLLFALVNNRGLGCKAVIVVPIDDVDLQVERIAELLPALRLLYHPRVVYLLTADLRHTEDMLALSFRGRERKVSECDNGTRVQSSQDWFKRLARATIEKSFPIAHRFSQSLLTLSGVIRELKRNGHFDDLLNHTNGTMTIAEWLTKWEQIVDDGQGLVTFRRLQQVLDVGGSDREGGVLVDSAHEGPLTVSSRSLQALARLLDVHDKGMATLTDGTIEGRWLGTLSVSFEIYWSIDTPQQSIFVGHRPRFHFKKLGNTDSDPDAAERENMVIAVSLGLDRAFNQKIVWVPSVTWDIGPAFAWTRWEGYPKSALFFWPFAWYPTPTQLLEWAREWRNLIATQVTGLRNPVEFLAFHWIRKQVAWLFDGINNLPETVATIISYEILDSGGEQCWKDLLEWIYTASPPSFVVGKEGDDGSSTAAYNALLVWREEALPLMAAPEFGLPDDVADVILQQFSVYVRRHNSPRRNSWFEHINELRQEHMSNALYQYLLSEHRVAESPEQIEKDAALLRDKIDRDQNKPWHQFMKKLKPKRSAKSVKLAKANPENANPADANSAIKDTRNRKSAKKL